MRTYGITDYAFATVTFVEWTHMLPEAQKPLFIHDVLDRYEVVAGEANTFSSTRWISGYCAPDGGSNTL